MNGRAIPRTASERLKTMIMRKIREMLGAAKYQNFIEMAQVAIVNGNLAKVAKLMKKYNIDADVDDVLKHLS